MRRRRTSALTLGEVCLRGEKEGDHFGKARGLNDQYDAMVGRRGGAISTSSASGHQKEGALLIADRGKRKDIWVKLHQPPPKEKNKEFFTHPKGRKGWYNSTTAKGTQFYNGKKTGFVHRPLRLGEQPQYVVVWQKGGGGRPSVSRGLVPRPAQKEEDLLPGKRGTRAPAIVEKKKGRARLLGQEGGVIVRGTCEPGDKPGEDSRYAADEGGKRSYDLSPRKGRYKTLSKISHADQEKNGTRSFIATGKPSRIYLARKKGGKTEWRRANSFYPRGGGPECPGGKKRSRFRKLRRWKKEYQNIPTRLVWEKSSFMWGRQL